MSPLLAYLPSPIKEIATPMYGIVKGRGVVIEYSKESEFHYWHYFTLLRPSFPFLESLFIETICSIKREDNKIRPVF